MICIFMQKMLGEFIPNNYARNPLWDWMKIDSWMRCHSGNLVDLMMGPIVGNLVQLVGPTPP